MKEHQTGNLLPNVVVSLLAGALSCVLILMLTHGPGLRERLPSGAETDDAAPSAEHAGAASRHDPPAGGSSASSTEAGVLAPSLLELQSQLTAAAEERAQLAATLVSLNRQVADLEEQLASRDSQAAADEAHATMDEPLSDGGFRQDRSERQYESLLAAGLDEQTASELQRRNDQFQLSRLELFDQAAREGWDDSDQLNERLEALQESRLDLRAELGDAAYDQYLYESGSSNRIAIDSVISGSAASQAGLQAGDMIISYAGERTFAVQDLQQATRAGSRGESVQLVFERSGQSLATDILRGPLGVTLRPLRQSP